MGGTRGSHRTSGEARAGSLLSLAPAGAHAALRLREADAGSAAGPIPAAIGASSPGHPPTSRGNASPARRSREALPPHHRQRGRRVARSSRDRGSFARKMCDHGHSFEGQLVRNTWPQLRKSHPPTAARQAAAPSSIPLKWYSRRPRIRRCSHSPATSRGTATARSPRQDRQTRAGANAILSVGVAEAQPLGIGS
jgi:hypothetical protein